MRFLDIIVSPFSTGGAATAVFTVGAVTVGVICALTAAVLFRHFRTDPLRKEQKKENGTVSANDGD